MDWAWDWWDERLGLRVDSWDVNSFANAINNLFAEGHVKYEPRKSIIEKGFTKERMAKDWKKLIDEVLKQKV